MNGKSTAYRIVLAQLGAAVFMAVLLYALGGAASGAAAAVGGAIAVISNFYFACHVFAGGVVPAHTVMRRFYVAEVVKALLTGGLFLVAILVLKLSFLPLLLGYAVALVVYWVALLMPTTAAAH